MQLTKQYVAFPNTLKQNMIIDKPSHDLFLTFFIICGIRDPTESYRGD